MFAWYHANGKGQPGRERSEGGQREWSVFQRRCYPQFRIKEQYKVPWYISEKEEADLILILRGLLFAKEYFASYKKTKKTNTFSFWLDSLQLEETEKKEYIPTLEMKGDSFTVSVRVLQDEAYGFYYPQAFFYQ